MPLRRETTRECIQTCQESVRLFVSGSSELISRISQAIPVSAKTDRSFLLLSYVGTSNALSGCHNDARNMSKWLCERQGYKQEDIVMLLDTRDATQMSVPTKANIVSFPCPLLQVFSLSSS